jgi:hypothetical protein
MIASNLTTYTKPFLLEVEVTRRQRTWMVMLLVRLAARVVMSRIDIGWDNVRVVAVPWNYTRDTPPATILSEMKYHNLPTFREVVGNAILVLEAALNGDISRDELKTALRDWSEKL